MSTWDRLVAKFGKYVVNVKDGEKGDKNEQFGNVVCEKIVPRKTEARNARKKDEMKVTDEQAEVLVVKFGEKQATRKHWRKGKTDAWWHGR